MLEAGKSFPHFSLQNQDGKSVKLDDYAGKWLVVYFYPKDDTPGCTIQGKSFTASKAEFAAAGISVVGVSQDDVGSHKNFCNKFSFTIDLLADTRRELIAACGIGQAEWNGMKVLGAHQLRDRPQGHRAQGLHESKPAGPRASATRRHPAA